MLRYDPEFCEFRDGIDLVRPSQPKLPPDMQVVALRKLRLLNQARVIGHLRVPPGNRLEALKADRSGQYSIRVNDQSRICFVWTDGSAADVEIVDYRR